MTESTTTEREPLVNPRELDGFKEVQEKIAKVRAHADRITDITDADVAGEAADALKSLRHVREDIQDKRKEEKAPYAEAGQSIDADFNELGATVEGVERSLKDRLLKYEKIQEKAREDERKREQRNAEARQKRENERAAKENRRPQHKPAPPPPTRQPAKGGNSKAVTRTVMKYEITNEAALPDEFVKRVPDKMKIKAAVAAGLVVEGVRTWPEEELVSR